jgi:hypothetical protein
LKELRLDNNRFSYLLEADFTPLEALEKLTVSGNSLVRLPPTIGSIGSLRVLNAESNRLEELPHELYALESADISISNNPVAEVGSHAKLLVKEYLKARHDDVHNSVRRSHQWNNQEIGFSPRAIDLLLRYFDGLDRLVSLRLLRKRPWSETALTQLFCGVMDAEEQRQESIEYTLEQLNKDLTFNHAEPMNAKVEIETHEYPPTVERWVTQADVGLVLSFVNPMDRRENWSVPWLLQAKRLYLDGKSYTSSSKFKAFDADQQRRMQRLQRLVGPFVAYFLYCPRPAALDPQLRTELAILRRRRKVGDAHPYTSLGPLLLNDLRLPEPTTAAGLFVAAPDGSVTTFRDVHSQARPLWTLEGTCPFSWFIISHFLSPGGAVLNAGLTSPARQIAMDIVQGRPEMMEALAQLPDLIPEENLDFHFLPAHTIRIEIRMGPMPSQSWRDR